MAEGPITQSPICSTGRCCAGAGGAADLGPASFLLDRVAEDFADRLAAVLRRFDLAVDLGTPGEAVRTALARLGSIGTIVAADVLPSPASLCRRRRGGAAISRRRARSRRVGAGAASRQRSAGHACADPPRTQARRPVRRGAARRRDAHRAAPGFCRGRNRYRRRRLAARSAFCGSA